MISEKNNKTLNLAQIFSKCDDSSEISVIHSETKILILELLKNKNMPFNEIVKNTGRSKSTVSIHLKELSEKDIISHKNHPTDHRKKIFHLNSKFIASVDARSPNVLKEIEKQFLTDNILNKDNFEFSFLLFHTLKSTLIKEGINIDTILNDSGKSIGNVIFDILCDDDFEVFIGNVAKFWEDNGLGVLSVEFGEILKIHSIDCFECQFLPKTGKPACHFDGGIIESLFTNYLGSDVDVTEVKCYTMGDNQCTFEIQPKNFSFSDFLNR